MKVSVIIEDGTVDVPDDDITAVVEPSVGVLCCVFEDSCVLVPS